MIKVSVILPVYNAEKYLEESLGCLISQTLKDIEIICVNDGSTDKSLAILKEFAKADKRIIVLNQVQNRSAGYVRNVGLKKAQGEYVAFLDADDLFDKEMLKKIYDACLYAGADIGVFSHVEFDNTTGIKTYQGMRFVLQDKYADRILDYKILGNQAFLLWNCAPWNKLYKRKFILENGIEYQDIKNANDVYFANIALISAKKMIYISTEEPLLFIRKNHPTQISKNRAKQPLCAYEAINKLYMTLMGHQDWDNFRQGFENYALRSLLYAIELLQGEEQRQLYNACKEAFLRWGFGDKEEGYFFSGTKKYQLDYILTHEYSPKFSEEIRDIENYETRQDRLEKIFAYIEKEDGKVALWGIGKLARRFLQACRTWNWKIDYLVDSDEKKQNTCLGNYRITDFMKIKEKIDFVLVLNPAYYEEIEKKVKEMEEQIKVIDIGSYLELGLNVEDCIR